jgi:hypothetical protein
LYWQYKRGGKYLFISNNKVFLKIIWKDDNEAINIRMYSLGPDFTDTSDLVTSPIFLSPKDAGIYGDLVFTEYPQILLNIFSQKYSTMMKNFNLDKNTLVWRAFVRISQDYLL